MPALAAALATTPPLAPAPAREGRAARACRGGVGVGVGDGVGVGMACSVATESDLGGLG